jgi:hypothetical protein
MEKKLKTSLLKLGMRQRGLLSMLLLNSHGIPTQSNRTGGKNNMNINRKGRSQTIAICK